MSVLLPVRLNNVVVESLRRKLLPADQQRKCDSVLQLASLSVLKANSTSGVTEHRFWYVPGAVGPLGLVRAWTPAVTMSRPAAVCGPRLRVTALLLAAALLWVASGRCHGFQSPGTARCDTGKVNCGWRCFWTVCDIQGGSEERGWTLPINPWDPWKPQDNILRVSHI